MARISKVLSLSLPPKMYDLIERLAKEENRTRSELLREALREYIDRREWRRLQRGIAARAKALGITGEEDVERIINEYRKEKDSL